MLFYKHIRFIEALCPPPPRPPAKLCYKLQDHVFRIEIGRERDQHVFALRFDISRKQSVINIRSSQKSLNFGDYKYAAFTAS